MAGDNDKDKKGFSGLSDLASEVSGVDEPIKPEPKAEAKPSTPKPPPQPQREKDTPEPERKSKRSPPPVETVTSGTNTGGSGGKWILGIIGVAFVIWLINNEGQNNRTSSYNPPSTPQSYGYPQSSPAPAVRAPSSAQNAGLQYTKPSVGTNNVLSVAQIRWCIREGIRIEAMRSVIDSNAEVGKFNRIVDDYNSRCGSYRYRQGSQSRAERDVESYRSQIVAEAIREARKLSGSYQPSYPSISSGTSNSSAPKKPSAKYTREAQQLLTDLGYDPGPIDGDYGRRTAAAVSAFQRDAGITQDGWIDQDLLNALRRAKAARKPTAVSQPKPQRQTNVQTPKKSGTTGGMPANAHLHYSGRKWECDDGYLQQGNECIKFHVPANAHLHYSGRKWECDDGYNPQGDRCIKFSVPAHAHLHYSGRKWECDDGYLQQGNECIKFHVPANAHLHYSGRKWECDDGYNPQGDRCIKFSVPANAHLHYSGRKWECDDGYKQQGSVCVSIFGK